MADEPVRLNDDGTVTCSVGQKRHRLRRPTMGELRQLRESQVQVEDDVQETFTPYREQLGELDAQMDDAEGDERRALRSQHRKVNDAALVEIEAVRAGWIREVFAVLAKPLPEPSDDDPAAELEPWMVAPELAVTLVGHWRAVPFHRGSSDPAESQAQI